MFRRLHRCATVLGLVLGLGWSPLVHSEDATLGKVIEFNKQALAAFEALDMDTAALRLKQALELCAAEGIDNHPAAARTHIHLGVVYIGGLGQQEKGIAEFRRALGIDPTIKVTKSLLSSEIKAAFDEAVRLGVERPIPESIPKPLPAAPPTPQIPKNTAAASTLVHSPVVEASKNSPIEVKALVPAAVHAERIVLAYRAGEEGEFLAREMHPGDGTTHWYREVIPLEATLGSQVQYYIEARNDEGEALASSGSATAPHRILLSTGKGPVSSQGRSADGDFLLWMVFGVGGGAGYFTGTPEHSSRAAGPVPEEKGMAWARLAHLAPEVGYLHNDHLIFSVQGRLQYVTGGESHVVDGRTREPTKTALALLAKATYLFGEPTSRIHPLLGMQAGYGYIRYPVSTQPRLGCGSGTLPAPCKDTVHAGPALSGAFAGLTIQLTENVGLYTALSGLLALPDLAVQADLNVGLALFR